MLILFHQVIVNLVYEVLIKHCGFNDKVNLFVFTGMGI